MTFKQMMKTQRRQQNRIGDLARDIAADAHFPEPRSRYELLSYLERRNACVGAMKVANEAWDAFVREVHDRDLRMIMESFGRDGSLLK